MPGYPVVLRLEGRLCVVVGGGRVAEGKIRRLLETDALVRVIAPEATEGIRLLAAEGQVRLLPRPYRHGDLAGAFIAVAATDDRATNAAVFEEAEERGIPCNAADDPEHCSFTLPAILRNGDLAIAVSTEGRSPALAVRIRDRLRRDYGGAELARFLDLAATLRDDLPPPGETYQERAGAWYRLVDSEVLDLLRAGRDEEARHRAERLLEAAPPR